MKKMALLALMALLWAQTAHPQFTQAVKDSALQLLKYPSAKYSIRLNFKPEDYLPDNGKPDLQKLSLQQLNDQKKGDYTDASLYQALALKSWLEEKNPQAAAQYLTEAGQKYQEWINAEPKNTTPVEELLSMCISSQNYQPIPGILEYALPLFPKHLPLLHKAIYYQQYVAKQYDISQQLINQARAIDSFDLQTLTYQSGLLSLYQMEAMQQRKPFVFAELPGLQAATMVQQPANTGLRHLYHFHQVFNLYLKIADYATYDTTNSIKLFDLYTLSPQEQQQVEAAASWMLAQLAAKGKNEAQLLNSLAVIHCIKKDYTGAAAYFDKAYQITKGSSEVEGKIVCQTFMDAYPQVAKLLEEKIVLGNDMQDYGSLLRVYNDYMPNQEVELALLKKVQAQAVNDPTKHQILATGYLKTGQLPLLSEPLALLGETTREDILIKLVAAIVNDKRSTAALYLNKLLHLQSDDKDGLKIKKLAGL